MLQNLILLTLVGLALPLNAQTINYNQVSLQASASQYVDNDVLSVVLTVQENGNNPNLLSQRVNNRMTKILDLAKTADQVETETTSYTTQPMYKNNKINAWEVKQNIKLSSKNIQRLTTLISKLNELANIQTMSFSVSDDLKELTKQKLTKHAIKKFRDKAQVITEQFDKNKYLLVDAAIDTQGGIRPKMMRLHQERSYMAMADTAIAPAVSGGTDKITVTVHGTIELAD